MPTEKLTELMENPNIANDLDDEKLDEIALRVMEGYEYDHASRAEWLDEVEEAIDMAQLKADPKSWPWKNSSNVRLPIISTACTQFAARTYPEIVKNGRVVHCATIGSELEEENQSEPQQMGPDQPPVQKPPSKKRVKFERAKRVARFMNYQLLAETDEWERSTDKLLTVLPVAGTVFRKTYFDVSTMSIKSEMCLPHEVIINNDIVSLEEAPRISHLIHLNPNKIIGNMRAGIYKEYEKKDLNLELDERINFDNDDILAIEQHCWLDLDEDGYEEPYVVVVHKETHKVLRVVARFDPEGVIYNQDDEVIRIDPIHYFTDHHFLPSVDGGYYSMGFGVLLLSLNKTVNSVTNMLLNAGALASLQGGFIGKGLRIKGGDMQIRPGQWHPIDSFGGNIKDNIVPINYKEPSTVLYQLLGFMMEHINQLTSVTEALSGTERAQNAPATTVLSLIEQGLKVFTSIMRRQYWAFKKEFAKVYRLNRLFLTDDKYKSILDDPEADLASDFDSETFDVLPVADPNVSSDIQRAAKVDYLMKLKSEPEFKDRISTDAILEYALEAADLPNPDQFIQTPPEPPPPIEELKLRQEAMMFVEEMKRKDKEFQRDIIKDQATMTLYTQQGEQYKATAMKLLAEADAANDKSTMDQVKMQLENLTKEQDRFVRMLDMMQKEGENFVNAKQKQEELAISARDQANAGVSKES